MKKQPGSPVRHAPSIILSHTICASSWPVTLPVRRLDEIVRLARLERRHELVGDGNGDVEVRDLGEVFLAGDEVQDVRMIDAQDAHVGAATRAALLHRVGRRIVELHERDGTRRDAGRRADHRALAAQTREGEARAAARLVNERHRAQRVVDAVVTVGERILDRQHEAGGELAERTACVHERRRVGLEATLRHQTVELLRQRMDRPVARAVPAVCFRDRRRHTPEHVLRLLRRCARLVLDQIALGQDGPSVLIQLRIGQRLLIIRVGHLYSL